MEKSIEVHKHGFGHFLHRAFENNPHWEMKLGAEGANVHGQLPCPNRPLTF